MSGTINLYSKLTTNDNYKLIQLVPELLKALEDPAQELTFKALDRDTSEVVLCSNDKTWVVKQKNHSNTVMLMKEFVPQEVVASEKLETFGMSAPTMDYLCFAKQTFELEPRPAKGQVDVSRLPIYHGDEKHFQEEFMPKITLQELFESSPCSKNEFDRIWFSLGGCTVNGFVCILASGFISKSLHITLMSILAENLDVNNLQLEETHQAVCKDMDDDEDFNPYSLEVIRTVLEKFCNKKDGGTYKLEMKQVAKWYGVVALKKFASKELISQDEFMIKWKSLFPPYFSCDIDLNLLKGQFARPLRGKLQYLPPSTLPHDIKDRFKMLFRIQNTWDIEDIKPFIEDLNTRGLKIDNFVMKYARRRKIGKQVLVSSR